MTLAVEDDESAATGEWKRHGVFRVDEGVFRVVLPLPNDGLQAVNVYVLQYEGGITIIDSGWSLPETRELLIGALAALDLTATDIDRFLITHVHRDHYEMSMAIRREFGTQVALGRGEEPTIDYVTGPDFERSGPQFARLRELGAGTLVNEILASRGASSDAPAMIEYPDEWLEPGEIKVGPSRTLAAVATPGHTRGHLVFYDESAGLLFAGDHVLPTITPSIGFEPVISPNPLGDFVESLSVVRRRPDARLLPAHGPLAPSTHTRVDELLAHHAGRLDEAELALRHEYTTGLEVAGQLGWTRRGRRLNELDLFNSMLAVSETGAHLDLLVAQGRARVELRDGINHYGPA